jgi:signal transduction histidine kinase
MMRRSSLRWRILLGALLWSVGLFLIIAVLHNHFMHLHPNAARAVLGAFNEYVPLGLVSLLCLAAGLLQVRSGLSAVDQLRRRLASVHAGRERRLEGRYPTEVQPLVDDLNALLEDRERSVARAIAKAGDLAHGLKTPLAILSQEAQRHEAGPHAPLATTIAQQIERMQRQIDYHLAHARAAGAAAYSGTQCEVRPAVDALVRTMQRLHAERAVAITIDVPEGIAVRTTREDLDEMLGNLLDNACKWAKREVQIRLKPETTTGVVSGTGVASGFSRTITIDDDGPGIEASMREAVLRRGVRADEAAPGSGLGLAIVRELAELYGGAIAIESSPTGGTRAVLHLPAAFRSG